MSGTNNAFNLHGTKCLNINMHAFHYYQSEQTQRYSHQRSHRKKDTHTPNRTDEGGGQKETWQSYSCRVGFGVTKFNFHMNFSRTALPYQWLMIFNLAMRVSRTHTIFSAQKCINLHLTSMCLFWVVRVAAAIRDLRFTFFLGSTRRSSIYRWLYYFFWRSLFNVPCCHLFRGDKEKKLGAHYVAWWRCSIENMLVLLGPDVEHEICWWKSCLLVSLALYNT